MSKKLEDYFIPFESTAFDKPLPQEEVDAIMAEVREGIAWMESIAPSVKEQMDHSELHGGMRTATVDDPDGNPITFTTIPDSFSDEEYIAVLEGMGIV
jgi:hypothetical protein